MKQTYIEFDGQLYNTSECKFYKDCVVRFDPLSLFDETIMHNGHWKYIEKDIVFDELTLVEREIENQIAETKQEAHREKILADFIAQYGHRPNVYSELEEWRTKYREYKEANPFAG